MPWAGVCESGSSSILQARPWQGLGRIWDRGDAVGVGGREREVLEIYVR